MLHGVPAFAACFLYLSSQFRIRRRAGELERACNGAYVSGNTKEDTWSKHGSIIIPPRCSEHPLQLLELQGHSICPWHRPFRHRAVYLLERITFSLIADNDDDDDNRRGEGTHERERISTLSSSFQEVAVSSPNHASSPNLPVWVQYSTGPVQMVVSLERRVIFPQRSGMLTSSAA